MPDTDRDIAVDALLRTHALRELAAERGAGESLLALAREVADTANEAGLSYLAIGLVPWDGIEAARRVWTGSDTL